MTSKKNFDDAYADCYYNHGATLASVRSIWEQEFLSKIMFEKNVWLGATDRNESKNFKWLNGDDGPTGFYDNFRTPKTPTHAINQDCLQMGDDGFWNDVVCTKKNLYFCQKDSYLGANSKFDQVHKLPSNQSFSLRRCLPNWLDYARLSLLQDYPDSGDLGGCRS